jgi:formylmethanofuran dehydrogenase subunit E
MEDFEKLEPSIKAKTFKSSHRLWRDGYLFSLSMNNDSEVWEWYSVLSLAKLIIVEEKEEEEKEHCLSCGKEVSKEEFELHNGFCENCYTNEIQYLDDDLEE